MTNFDIAIVGSGFGGSLLAMIARKLGYSVVLLERGEHPRIVVGESSTPLANLLLEELSVRYDLPFIRPFSKWGSWQHHYPNVACGLKRGFTFFHHDLDRPDRVVASRDHQLLVAASPNNRISDTHWYRAEFDHRLVQEAQNLGVTYFDRADLHTMSSDTDGVTLCGTRLDASLRIRAKFLIDATGPRGFVHQALRLGERSLPDFPVTEALFSHFTGVRKLAADPPVNGQITPYPIDDAAVHHVFQGGWIWVLQFNNGVTSAGVAARSETAGQLRLEDGEPAWKRLLARMPEVEEQFSSAQPLYDFKRLRPLAFRSTRCTGNHWAMLPSAYGFVDPLLSTGFPLTLFGLDRIARLLEQNDPTAWEHGLADYACETDEDLLAAARLVGALYANMNNFPAFVAISLVYFAAASFAEAVRRLGKPGAAPRFLLRDHPVFALISRLLLETSSKALSADQTNEFIEVIHRAIAPIDIAGLTNSSARNWFPVRASDLLKASSKLGASHEEVQCLLQRSGFFASIDDEVTRQASHDPIGRSAFPCGS